MRAMQLAHRMESARHGDPGAPDELAKQGLRDLIHLGKACPAFCPAIVGQFAGARVPT